MPQQMRRDARKYEQSEGDDERDAIAAQWTRIWMTTGGLIGDPAAVTTRPEFKAMWPRLRALPKGSRVLDGGCGRGEFTVWLTRAGYPTLGIDISHAAIAELQSAYPDAEFAVADIRETGFADQSFDAYFSWGTFEHFEEGLDRVVREAHRLLRPGGLLFVSTPFDNLRSAIHGTLREPWIREPNGPTRFYQWRLTRAELATALMQHGFEIDSVKIILKRHGLQRWIQSALGLDEITTPVKAAARALSPVLPAVVAGHMILAVARRPAKL